jgi:hypothetical protein
MTHKQLSASIEDDAPIKLPPLETQSRLADCLQDFTVLLWEHATVNMRKRGDETLTPHDMKTAYRHLLASKETSKTQSNSLRYSICSRWRFIRLWLSSVSTGEQHHASCCHFNFRISTSHVLSDR